MTTAAPQQNTFDIDHQTSFPTLLTLHLDTRRISKKKLSIRAQINFAPAWHKLAIRKYFFFKTDWTIQFAVRSGDLVFNLKGVIAPLKSRSYRQRLPVHATITRHQTVATSNTQSQKRGATVDIPLPTPTSPRITVESGSESTLEVSATHEEKTAFAMVTVHTTGDESAPIWTFESKSLGRHYLLGLFSEKLCTLYLSNGDIYIHAAFRTFAPGLCIEAVDSTDYEEMSNIKKVALQAQLKKVLYKQIIDKHYLASCTLRKECRNG